MSLLKRLEKLEAQVKPKTIVRFTMDEDEIDESIPGVIWVFFAIEESTKGIVNIQPR